MAPVPRRSSIRLAGYLLLISCGFVVVGVTARTAAFGVPDPTSGRRLAARTEKEDGKLPRSAPSAALLTAAAALAVAATSVLSPLPSLAADSAVDVAHGAALFKAECAGCHMGGNNFMSDKKTLKKDALLQYQSLDQTKLQAFVANQMPHSFLPFHSKWSDQDFADAVGYVLDQAVNDKWE